MATTALHNSSAPEQERAQAAQEMLKVISGFWLSRAVQAAATLGIADHLAGGARPIDQLAAELSADRGALYRLMRALSSFGIFQETDGQVFAQNAMSEVLRSDVPGSLRSAAMMELGLVHYQSWERLIDSVRTGNIAFDMVFQMNAWEYFEKHPQISETFNDSMTRLTDVVQRAVVEAYDFSRYRKIVDVGGGRGRLLSGILESAPQARGVLSDQPKVIGEARRALAGAPVAGRVDFQPCDFFQSVPEGGDLYTLKWILHDWSDDDSVRILRNVRAAMAPNARVLLIETVLPEPNTPGFGVLMDLNMLVMTGGRERRPSEFRELLAAAGLKMVDVYPTQSPVGIVEAMRA